MIMIWSLSRDHLPSSWHPQYSTFWDYALFAGSFGLLLKPYFLFLRFVPLVNWSEVKALLHDKGMARFVRSEAK